ncbi:MAG: CDP-alcohol phosphatidyltransferase family protein [Alphaproteobacteria bacterium]|nr:CDP-alcohol phosphatidyltransferase family protein [Alphaproteobacteria bacterium]MBV9370141.1 CDP-alcohol phosphatidyltransferase family protein [Alphaproteobacteria bacterium]MBV9901481.1 CDP-alcohol phosphatidyltransferase family protein [Alphaproteobacteria bacterium]
MESEIWSGDATALLSFADSGDAERRIAGVAAVAHMAAEARSAGARSIAVALGGEPSLSPAAADDLRRACSGIPVRIGGPGAAAAARPFQSRIPLASPSAARRWVLRGTGKRSDGVVSRALNRPLSRSISSLLLRWPGIRPWHATLATAAIALAMFASLVAGGRIGLMVGGILFHLASVVDGVDGEIARATYRSSARGAILDSGVDMATNLLFYLGLTVALTQLRQPNAALISGWSVLAGLTGLALMVWLVRQRGEPGNFDLLKRFYRIKWPRGVPRLLVDTFVMITSRDFFALGSALLILAGQARLVSLGLAGFATLWVIFILMALPPLLRGAAGGPRLAVERGPTLR